jgi:PQ loop repeat
MWSCAPICQPHHLPATMPPPDRPVGRVWATLVWSLLLMCSLARVGAAAENAALPALSSPASWSSSSSGASSSATGTTATPTSFSATSPLARWHTLNRKFSEGKLSSVLHPRGEEIPSPLHHAAHRRDASLIPPSRSASLPSSPLSKEASARPRSLPSRFSSLAPIRVNAHSQHGMRSLLSVDDEALRQSAPAASSSSPASISSSLPAPSPREVTSTVVMGASSASTRRMLQPGAAQEQRAHTYALAQVSAASSLVAVQARGRHAQAVVSSSSSEAKHVVQHEVELPVDEGTLSTTVIIGQLCGALAGLCFTVQYLPQTLHNYRRRSVRGFSSTGRCSCCTPSISSTISLSLSLVLERVGI